MRGVRKYGVFDGKAVVHTVVREIILRPYLSDNFQGFREEFPIFLIFARVGIGMELRALVWPDTAAKTDIYL